MTEQSMMSTKQLAGLLYSMGRTFDGLQTNYMNTEEFLRTGNPDVVNSKADYLLLKDLMDAATYTLHYDYKTQPFNLIYLVGINQQLSRTAAMYPGTIRTKMDVMVTTPLGKYVPGEPDPTQIEELLKSSSKSEGGLRDAADLFIKLAKIQPFGDGNKRTALMAANGLLLAHDQNRMLNVPVDNPERTEFNTLLAEWYINDNDAVSSWLAEWNEAKPQKQQDSEHNNADLYEIPSDSFNSNPSMGSHIVP